MYQSGNIQEELGEALSRASVLQSLDTAYATSTPKKTAKIGTTSATKTKGPNSGNKTPRNGRGQPNANEDVVAMLQVLVDDNSNKTGKFFMEQIKGKSIILENVRTQTAATKFSEQEKRRMKRRLKTSNACLKKKGAILHHKVSQMRVPGADELLALNNTWKSYARNLLKGCKSSTHYQARLMTAEMIGAEVIILDSKGHPGAVGRKGIIVEQSKNCLFVASSNALSPKQAHINSVGVTTKRKLNQLLEINTVETVGGGENSSAVSLLEQEKIKIFRVVRINTVLGIILPVTVNRYPNSAIGTNSDISVSQNICVLYGNKILPSYTTGK